MLESIARGARVASFIGAGLLAAGSAHAADPIKLGVLEDQSGDFALATIGKVHGIQLATDEISVLIVSVRGSEQLFLVEAGGVQGAPLQVLRAERQAGE